MSSITHTQSTPNLNNFTFNTIGKEPVLLKRFNAVPNISFQPEHRSPSPSVQNQYEPQTQAPVASSSRFLQALTRDPVSDVQMQNSTPVRRARVDVFGQKFSFTNTAPVQPANSNQNMQQSTSIQSTFSHSTPAPSQPPLKSFQSGNATPCPDSELAFQSTLTSIANPIDNTNVTSPYAEVNDIQIRLLNFLSSAESSTASTGSQLMTALDTSRNARRLAEVSLSSVQEVSKTLQVSLTAAQGAAETATRATALVQDAIDAFSKKEKQWGKVFSEMKTDIFKLGEYVADQERRYHERQLEMDRQRDREEKERQGREREEKERMKREREEKERQALEREERERKETKSAQMEKDTQLSGNDVTICDISSSNASQSALRPSSPLSTDLPDVTSSNQEAKLQQMLKDAEAQMQQVRNLVEQMEHKKQEEAKEQKRKEEELKRAEEEKRKYRVAEEQERKRIENRRRADENKRQQKAAATAERQRRTAHEEMKRKEAEMEMEHKRLADKEERMRTEQNLREDLRRRKAEGESERRKSAERGSKATPPNPPSRQSSQPIVSSTLQVDPLSSLALHGTLQGQSPTLPAKPTFAVFPEDATTSKQKKKETQKAAKVNNSSYTSGEVHLGLNLQSPSYDTTPVSGTSTSHPSRPCVIVPEKQPEPQVSGDLQRNPLNASSTDGPIATKSELLPVDNATISKSARDKSNPVKKETPGTNPAVIAFKVKKEQVEEDHQLLRRVEPVKQSKPLAIINAVPSLSQPSQAPPVVPVPISSSSVAITSAAQKDLNGADQRIKRMRSGYTDQPQPNAGVPPSDVQQGHAAAKAQPKQKAFPSPSEAPSGSTSSLQGRIVAIAQLEKIDPLPALAPVPPPTHVNGRPSLDEVPDRLRQSPIGPDMQGDGGWNNVNSAADEERLPMPPARTERPTQRYYVRTYDHYSPHPGSPPRHGSPPLRSSSPYSRNRSRSPYYSPRPRSPSPSYSSDRFNRWDRGRQGSRSRSPPQPSYLGTGYGSRKRVREPPEADPYPVHRPYHDPSPSPHQSGTLESRLRGEQDWRTRNPRNTDRPALLRRLGTSNEPSDPPSGPRGRNNGSGLRGRGRGGGSNRGGRLAQRIHSMQRSSGDLFDRLQMEND